MGHDAPHTKAALGGSLFIDTPKGGGTRVVAEIPVGSRSGEALTPGLGLTPMGQAKR